MLLQGLPLPRAEVTTSDTLPPAQEQPASHEVTLNPHTHQEPEDTTGQVHRQAMSRTMAWRHRKKAGTESGQKYCCRVCGKPMTTAGHTQFRGQRYCPDAPGQVSKEEWLDQKRAEAAAKAAAKQKP